MAELMRKFLPSGPLSNTGIKSRLADDTMARVYLVQLFAFFADPANGNSVAQTEYYEGISHLSWDVSPRVAFEAIHCLAHLGWSRMSAHSITIREGIEVSGPQRGARNLTNATNSISMGWKRRTLPKGRFIASSVSSTNTQPRRESHNASSTQPFEQSLRWGRLTCPPHKPRRRRSTH